MPQPNREELIRWALGDGEEPVIAAVAEPPLRAVAEKLAEMPVSPPATPEPATPKSPEAIMEVFPPGTCPNDGQPFQELGGALRCAACGCQPRVDGPPGLSRAEYASGEWRRRAE